MKSEMIEAMSVVLPEKGCLYFSTPLCSGYQLYHSIASKLPIDPKRILECNKYKAISDCNQLKRIIGIPIINPARLHIEGWGGSDYLDFWELVIKRFAKFVTFPKLFAYSKGCCYEALICYKYGISTCTYELTIEGIPFLNEIDSGGFHLKLDDAINNMQNAGMDTSFFQRVRSNLESVRGVDTSIKLCY